MEWYIDKYGRDSELCGAVALGLDDEPCYEYETCLNCPHKREEKDLDIYK